ncbi:LuxR C-terminal-related transcriptional regulator [Geodermatophilus sp. URMC 62]|uniref:LuxR C-terminal-related transcriptional regulator n=1 Tax=Geodermatophilus sp. URMC 62 TaxID=3423414 RepID=UPI00406C09DD
MVPSQRLCEIVLAQLGRLDAAEWRVLEVLATAEPLPAGDVEALSSPEALARLERLGVVVDHAGGTPGLVRAAHPLYTEVVRSRAPEAVLRLVRRELLAGPGDDRSPALAAARRLALLDGSDPAPDAGRLTEAARSAAAALDLACVLGRVDDAQAVLDREVPAARPGPGRSLLAATAAVLAFHGGDPTGAVHQATAVRSTAPAGGPAWQLATAAAALGHAVTGAPRSALAMVAEGRAGLAWPDGRVLPAFVHLALAQAEVMALRLSGRARELEARAAELHRCTLAGPEWYGDAVAALHCGWAALVAGRVRVAVRRLVDAQAGLRRADPLGLLPLCRSHLAMARALLGDVDGAQQLVAELDDPERAVLPAYVPFVLFARAVVAGVQGHPAEAARLSREAAREAAEQGQVTTEAVVLHTTFRFGRPLHAADRLAVLARRCESAYVRDLADHVVAITAEDGDELDGISRRFEEAGLVLNAADAAAEAAAAHEHQGARRSAATALARGVTLARACGLADSQSLQALLPPSLTAREEEVARLASRGLSNVQIADRLVVSVRTVEAHLSHIYGKLGITGRAELSDALVVPGPRNAPTHSGLAEWVLPGRRLSARR